MKYSRILVIATLALLAACGSDSTSPTDDNNGNVSGTVSFAYTGGGSGSYSATGGIASSTSDATAHATTWAAAWKDNSDNSTNVFSNIARTGGLSDAAFIIINRQTTGTGAIDANCVPTTTTSCNMVGLVIGANESGSTFGYSCTAVSGTITISSISSTNVTGIFSGTGMCINGTSFATSVFAVPNGSFNVALLSEPPG